MRVRHQRRQLQRFCARVEILEERKLLTSIVVNTVSDAASLPTGMVSLRAAIKTANSSVAPTIITFSPAVFSTHKTITLLQGELTLSNTKEPTTITGPEPGITISAHHNSDVFSGGVFFVSAKNVKVALSKMTITGGFGHGDDITTDGGGIYNQGGTMMLTNVTVSGNSAQSEGEPCYGGGIYNEGTMVLTNSIVSGNSLSGTPDEGGFGGGIENGGTMTLKNVIVSGNSSDRNGGGIDNSGGTMTLMTVTVSGNSGGGGGGGVENDGKMTLTNSTVSGNTVTGGFRYDYTYGFGGGIDNGGALTLTNSTVSGNSAGSGGGGIENDAKMTLTLSNSTVSGNSADTGGGIDNDSGTVKPANSIIAGNKGGTSDPDVSGPFTSQGHNLVGKTNGSTGWVATDLTGTIAHPLDAKLGTLANNGGPTQTLLPLTGSPAINAGSNALIPSGITTDQRGLPRIFGGTVDIGAVEVQSTQTGSISGMVFNDADATGTFTTGDTPLANVRVYVDLTNLGAYKIGDPFAMSDAHGKYTITGAPAGSDLLRQVSPAGFRQTLPNNGAPLHVTVSASGALTGQNFGDTQKVHLSGLAYNDLNGDGARDNGEPVLVGVTVYLDKNGNKKFDPGEPNTTTTSQGYWVIGDLPAGTYTARFAPKGTYANYLQTQPANKGGHTATLASGQTADSLLFGIYKPAPVVFNSETRTIGASVQSTTQTFTSHFTGTFNKTATVTNSTGKSTSSIASNIFAGGITASGSLAAEQPLDMDGATSFIDATFTLSASTAYNLNYTVTGNAFSFVLKKLNNGGGNVIGPNGPVGNNPSIKNFSLTKTGTLAAGKYELTFVNTNTSSNPFETTAYSLDFTM